MADLRKAGSLALSVVLLAAEAGPTVVDNFFPQDATAEESAYVEYAKMPNYDDALPEGVVIDENGNYVVLDGESGELTNDNGATDDTYVSTTVSNQNIYVVSMDQADSSKKLPNVMFEIWTGGSYVASATTGENGVATFSGLSLNVGTVYSLSESIPPEGYWQNNANYDFVIVDPTSNASAHAGGVQEIVLGQEFTFSVYNERITEISDIPVEKRWIDENNKDGLRTDVTVVLCANGVETDKTIVLSEFNDWKSRFTDLPKFDDNNQEIVYTVKEVEIANYTSVISKTKDGYTITNTYNPTTPVDPPVIPKISVPVQKVWNDENNKDGLRTEVAVKLYANGNDTGKTIKLNDQNNWKGSFTDLTEYDDNGMTINYTVVESEIEGYTANITGNSKDGFVITNTHVPVVPKINVPVQKVWNDENNKDGLRTEVTVKLYANGNDTGKTIKLNDQNDWKGSFTDLLKYDDNGMTINYTVVESEIEGYTANITGNSKDGFVITNTHVPVVPKINVPVQKVWNDENNKDGLRTEVTIRIYGNGEYVAKIKLNDSNNWKGSFNDLPEVDTNGRTINYTVTEAKVTGYTTEIAGNSKDGFTITNTHVPVVPEIPKISVPVQKVWNDENNKDGIRPKCVTIKLYANGNDTGKTIKLSESNGWKSSFTDLNKVDDNGKTISYTVTEVEVEGYTWAVTTNSNCGFVVTNTHVPVVPQIPKIDIPVQKIWADANNKDGIRPTSVTVELYANSSYTGKTVKLSESNNWHGSFDDLPEVDTNGKTISYAVAEVKINGYTSEVTGSSRCGFVITNTHEPKEPDKTTIDIPIQKVWMDENNKDGLRTQVTVKLLRNGTDTGLSITLSESNNWIGSFVNLMKYDANGNAINYTVSEVKVEGYTSVITGNSRVGFVITNTHEPEKPKETFIDIPVKKVWDDENNKDGLRANVTVKLLSNGRNTGLTVILSESNKWTSSFVNLAQKDANGNIINYTVEEVKIEGYTSTITGSITDGFTITNKHVPKQPENPAEPSKPTPSPKPATPSNPKIPKTGESNIFTVVTAIAGIAFIILIILAIIFVVCTKKNNSHRRYRRSSRGGKRVRK